MTTVLIREMHGNIPYVMEAYQFDSWADAMLFTSEPLPQGRWYEICA